MANITLTGDTFVDISEIEIDDLWANSTSIYHSAAVGVVDTGDADIVFQGTGLGQYDAHGYAKQGTITSLSAVFTDSGGRADWEGLSIDAGSFEHTVKTGNTPQFIDALFGANDTIHFNSGGGAANGFAGKDTLIGGASGDVELGGTGKDTLRGNGGEDLLFGQAGSDKLFGGAAADIFIFSLSTESHTGAIDTIMDLENIDQINLADIDADTVAAGKQDFFLADTFTGVAGALTIRYQASHDRTIISGYTDTDNHADLIIYVSGDHHDFSNFFLNSGI